MAKVNIVAKLGWILERLARELEPLGATINAGNAERAADPRAAINYYMPARDILKYPAPGLAVGLYTHGSTAFDIVDRFAACVTMNIAMGERLRGAGARRVVTIRPGTEAPSRSPVFGVCGRVYGKERKGADLVNAAVAAGFTFHGCSDYRPLRSVRARYRPPCRITHGIAQRADFYKSIDYLVITSTEEGGPMPLLEAIAHQVPVIAPRGVGWCDEFPAIRYLAGSWDSLHKILHALTVPPSWKDWTEQHRQLLESIR